jgi:hypothetical protein
MFALLATLSFVLRGQFSNAEVQNTFLVFGIIFSTASTVVAIVAVFQSMTLRQEQIKHVSAIKKEKKYAALVQEQFTEYIEKVAENLTKIYPDYEKEIFKSISPSDAEQLSVYLAKYPELKFNGVMQKHVETMRYYIDSIYSHKKEIQDIYEKIKNLQQCDWFLFKNKLHEDIVKEINED